MIFSAIWPAVWTHCEYPRVEKNGNNAGYSRFFLSHFSPHGYQSDHSLRAILCFFPQPECLPISLQP